ncbi:lipase 2 [Rhodotorula kratochvilovae]
MPSSSSPPPVTPNRPHPAAHDEQRAESPFSASPASLSRPQLAHVPSSPLQRASPLVLDSLTRPTLPSSSLSHSNASSSISSLQSLMDKSAADAMARRSSLQLSGTTRTPRSRRSSVEVDPIQEEGGNAGLSELSWGTKWWPFAVVEPESAAAGAQAAAALPLPPTPPVKDAHDASRGFLSLFAGKQAVEEAQAQHETQARQDQLEAQLLDASLDELTLAASRSVDSVALEADEAPPVTPIKRTSTDKALPPSPPRSPPTKGGSFLPSLFSQTTISSVTDTASASLATTTSRLTSVTDSAAASLASTSSRMSSSSTSLLNSLTISNPFNSSPASFFTSSARSPSSPPARPHRHYSTKRHPSADEGPTARPSEVEDLVDEGDRQAIKEEVSENAELFSILKEKYQAPRLPIVFCHGLFGFDYLGPAGLKPLRFSYWIGVEEALQAMGVEVMIGRVPASASIEERAKVLCQLIGERFPGREVNLIGHSMGGLDGRFLISRLKPTNFKVRSLTTISTPHRGSSFADYLLEDILGAERVPAFLSVMKAVGVPGGGKAFDDLTTTKMARFNEETPDDPSVKYISYGAEFTPSWSNAFRIPWGVVYEREGANDGLVSVESAKWGDYRATLHNVNHLDLIGWVGKVRYSFAAWSGHEIKFRPISMFCTIAEQLAEEGL